MIRYTDLSLAVIESESRHSYFSYAHSHQESELIEPLYNVHPGLLASRPRKVGSRIPGSVGRWI